MATSESPEERHARLERALAALIVALGADIARIARLMTEGGVGAQLGPQAARVKFYQAHVQAATLGLALAGYAPADAGGAYFAAQGVGERAARAQQQWMRGFETDLVDGRYRPKREGGEGARARAARAAMYGKALKGTANLAWLDAMRRRGELILWLLGPNEDHCGDCVFEAGLGWRNPWSLTRVPGDGRTACLVFCKCSLATKDGQRSFEA